MSLDWHKIACALPFTMTQHDPGEHGNESREIGREERRRAPEPPPSTKVIVDVRQALTSFFIAFVMGGVLLWGQMQTFGPRIENVLDRILVCQENMVRQEKTAQTKFNDINMQIMELRRDLYRPHFSLPNPQALERYMSWKYQEWWI